MREVKRTFVGAGPSRRLQGRRRWLCIAALVSGLSSGCGGGRSACHASACEAAGATCGKATDGCGGSLDCGTCQPIAAGDSWRIPGLPVEKLLSTAPGELVALVEHHVVSRLGTRAGYVIDHPRRGLVLRHGTTTPEELQGAVREGELLTDLAAGPEFGSVWVAAVRWNAESKEIERRVALFVDSPAEPGVAPMQEKVSMQLPPAHFAVDESATSDPLLRYHGGNTLDVLRIVGRGAFLGVVGRNAAGTAYAERYTYIEGRLQRDTSVALTHPSLWIQTAMTGGTYDVLGWLGNRYRVHAALADSGTLYAALVVRYSDLSGVDALFGSHLGGSSFDLEKDSEIDALILAVDEKGGAAPVEARRISNFEMGSLLLPMLVSGERCLYGGLSRGVGPPAGRSEPTLFEVGGTPYTLTSTHGSTAFQALAIDEAGRIWAGGSWGWSQNPSGLSIGGGERFVSRLPSGGEVWSEGNILLPGQRRSEARALLLPSRPVICVGGMDNGPDTHAADLDPSLVSGDGFVDCLARQ